MFRLLSLRPFAALLAGLVLASPIAPSATVAAPEEQQAASPNLRVGPSGLPVPRFVSLKSGRVNARIGPGVNYAVSWLYVKAGLPMEIIQEYDNWRRVRDADGADGWVFHSLLSGKRTALVAPWSSEAALPLRNSGAADAAIVAQLQPKVLATVERCSGEWCRISGDRFDGWMKQDQLFGVYPGEVF